MTLYPNSPRTAYWPLALQQLFSLALGGLLRMPSWLEWSFHFIHKYEGSGDLTSGSRLEITQSNKNNGPRCS
jgi:hypothetical protein